MSKAWFCLDWGAVFLLGRSLCSQRVDQLPPHFNSFFLFRYVVHTCGLLISRLQILTHRTGRYYRECCHRNLVLQWPTWQPQVTLEASLLEPPTQKLSSLRLFTDSPTITISFPLCLGISSCLLQEPPQYRRMQWHCLEGGSCPKGQVHPQQQSRGGAPLGSLQVSPLSLSTRFVQFSYFKSLCWELPEPHTQTHWRPAPSCGLHSLQNWRTLHLDTRFLPVPYVQQFVRYWNLMLIKLLL